MPRVRPIKKASKAAQHVAPLLVWEHATEVAESAESGVLSGRYCTRLTWALALLFCVMLWPHWGVVAVPMALVFGRLMALDMTTYTLPNIYTIPLACMGLVASVGSHFWATVLVWAMLGMAGAWGRWRAGSGLGQGLGLGEGDLKLLAAMVGFLGVLPALAAMALGCLLWLPGAWVKPRQALPLGVPLVLGWVVVLAFPALPNLLFSAIAV